MEKIITNNREFQNEINNIRLQTKLLDNNYEDNKIKIATIISEMNVLFHDYNKIVETYNQIILFSKIDANRD